jgi:oligoendopeptidase F
MKMLSAAAERMGGPIWESYRFLSGHQLYDIASAPNKMSIGYTTYFENYEAPFIFVDPDTKDLVFTLFHEFGHFTDWYRNYCIAGDYETGETYSQAMQYLAFAYAEPFTDRAREKNLRATLSDLLIYSVLQEGAFGDFELRVYALAPEELTVEKLDEVFGQCLADYGLAGLSGIRFKDNFWSVYQHFFAYPGYVISYSNSAVAAMQICRLEAEEPGAGVKAFCRLLDRTHGKKFAAVLAEAGLDSPFEAATLEKTAEFLKQVFEME